MRNLVDWSSSIGRRVARGVLVVLVGALGLLAGCASRGAASSEITVVLRYDDYSAKSPTALEARLFGAFRARGITLTVGAIPFVAAGAMTDPAPQVLLPLDVDKAALLRTALTDGAVEVGLHGYSHQANGTARMTEFTGRDYALQVERLERGRALLEDASGAPVTLFIPPWNTYDGDTLRALQDTGFGVLSAELRGAVPPDCSLSLVPFTCYPRGLPDALAAARASGDPQPVIAVLFHSYDFTEADPYRGLYTDDDFVALLDWLLGQPDVRVRSVGQAVADLGTLDARRYALNRASIAWSEALIPPLQVQVADRTWLASNVALLRRAQGRVLAFYGGLLLAGMAVGLLVARAVWPERGRMGLLLRVAASVLALAVLAYALRDGRVNWRGALAAVLVLGPSVGLWIAHIIGGRVVATAGRREETHG